MPPIKASGQRVYPGDVVRPAPGQTHASTRVNGVPSPAPPSSGCWGRLSKGAKLGLGVTGVLEGLGAVLIGLKAQGYAYVPMVVGAVVAVCNARGFYKACAGPGVPDQAMDASAASLSDLESVVPARRQAW